uniref:Transmembrane protein n=1 Tax=Plectus sambesii TaxID=2011161 RepID=A0A914WSW1_9BILA
MALRKWSPADQLTLVKSGFVALCLLDTMHWCALIYNEYLPNVWCFYSSWHNVETLYLAVRLTADLIVGMMGVGAALWGRWWLLAVPCLFVQSGFIMSRAIVWIRRGPLPFTPPTSDMVYIAAEFAVPFAWCVCALATINVLRSLHLFQFVPPLDQPPIIMVTVDEKAPDSGAQLMS